jgi:hypothetical protein
MKISHKNCTHYFIYENRNECTLNDNNFICIKMCKNFNYNITKKPTNYQRLSNWYKRHGHQKMYKVMYY